MFVVVSWGKPSKPPILMVHGFMDTAATFIPLVEQLTDDYYYVGFDMPGKYYTGCINKNYQTTR